MRERVLDPSSRVDSLAVEPDRFATGPVEVKIAELDLTGSLRSAGIDERHLAVLMESEVKLPPIIVHRATMRVLDGFHRVHAVVLRGAETIETEFFDGTDRDALVQAVKLNSVHGLPLSRDDRIDAARRVLTEFPDWSDRAIATLSGISAKRVGLLRKSLGGDLAQARVGRDGRVRPLDTTEGRLIAARVFAARPDASLREVAAEAGVSVGTARDVRARLSRGEAPADSPGRGRRRPQVHHPAPQAPEFSPEQFRKVLGVLRRDPSVRLTDTGRRVLRLIEGHQLSERDWDQLADGVPAHAADMLAETARGCAEWWSWFAASVRHRHREHSLDESCRRSAS